jgi:hypothetical protein
MIQSIQKCTTEMSARAKDDFWTFCKIRETARKRNKKKFGFGVKLNSVSHCCLRVWHLFFIT